MRALVLSGGGAKGAYEAGIIHTLICERGETFDVVCGTSIGAINAAFVAQEKVSELASVWHTIGKSGIVEPLAGVGALQHLYQHVVGLLHGQSAFERLADIGLAGLDFERIGPLAEIASITGALRPDGARMLLARHLDFTHLRRILLTSATNLSLRRQETFHAFPDAYKTAEAAFLAAQPAAVPIAADIFAEAVRASGAIPGAFSPVELKIGDTTHLYVDGGVTNNTPIGQAIDAGADDITIVYVDPTGGIESARTPRNLAAILYGCFSLMQQCILDLDFRNAMRVNDAIEAGSEATRRKRTVTIRTFRPSGALEPGIIDFDRQELVDAAFARGADDARANPQGTDPAKSPVPEHAAVLRGSESGAPVARR